MAKRETREEKIRRLLEREDACPACGGSGSHHVLDGGELREIRLKAGMEQKVLAAAAGVPAPNLCDLEKGKRRLSLEMADRLLKALGI
jgi:DNA-binding transcriptional regulator YiaG